MLEAMQDLCLLLLISSLWSLIVEAGLRDGGVDRMENMDEEPVAETEVEPESKPWDLVSGDDR